jgi:hypothetical protein
LLLGIGALALLPVVAYLCAKWATLGRLHAEDQHLRNITEQSTRSIRQTMSQNSVRKGRADERP